jgi:hypothetical protein
MFSPVPAHVIAAAFAMLALAGLVLPLWMALL